MSKFLKLFASNKPVIGMLHLGRKDSPQAALELTKYELDAYLENGIDGVLVEDYFGNLEDVRLTLEYLYKLRNDVVYGVNYLRDYETAFQLASEFMASFVQIDSVAGHLPPVTDAVYGNHLASLRKLTNIPVIGGVRFKYQPYLSGRTLKEDLMIGQERCDGIVVTGAGTGEETPLSKAREFKANLPDVPLIIGAGLTLDNCQASLTIADAAIVGSFVKDTHQDSGVVSGDNVLRLMKKIETIRK